MIWETKGMIAGCFERMAQSSCGTCERRDSCAFQWPKTRQINPTPASADRRARRAQIPFDFARHPFFAFLSEVAKAFEISSRPGEAPAREQADSVPTGQPGSLRREVERRLEPMLALGEIRIEEVARQMGYGRQTLYRRLKAEGVTFAELLDGLRRRLALRLLRDEGLAVKETAYRLGFSDPAAFSRAFKRWTGSSPSAARNRR